MLLIGYVTNFVQFLALLKFWSLNCGKVQFTRDYTK